MVERSENNLTRKAKIYVQIRSLLQVERYLVQFVISHIIVFMF